MNVEIRPMNGQEYEAWLPNARAGYAADMIANGGVAEDNAYAKAEKDFATLLTNGVETAGHWLYTIVADGEPAGDLWLAERGGDVGKSLFVYDVHVRKECRGRGLERAAMLFAEEEARRRGLPNVAPNVFGGNEVARGLYRSLGYRESAVWMVKDV
jgi:ribosomal protein S18 acetylase RimI-like enzyme